MSIVVIDFETGGVRPEHPSIQLAAIAVDDSWNEVGSFEQKIRFDVKTADPEALKMNHYDPEQWKDAVTPGQAFQDFCYWLGPYMSVEMKSKRTGRPYKVARLAAFNASFDKDRLWAMADGSFVPCHPQALCIMQLAAWSIIAGTKSESLKLSVVASALGISPDGAHDALADVRIAAKVAGVLLSKMRGAA